MGSNVQRACDCLGNPLHRTYRDIDTYPYDYIDSRVRMSTYSVPCSIIYVDVAELNSYASDCHHQR